MVWEDPDGDGSDSDDDDDEDDDDSCDAPWWRQIPQL
jgi:hypothetical protein